ncbi:MAG: ATP-binding protein [Ahniella sp.]|nr:ATP-binding protein [Ahniella sp.]
MNLRRKLAEAGFESNDDYEFQVNSLFAVDLAHLRSLHVAGDSGRRKTAFANALAQALGYPRVVYHDFSVPEPPAPTVIVTRIDEDDTGETLEPNLTGLDRAVIEACAFSEAERSILIIDQLQAADFRDQVRLFEFIRKHYWHTPGGSSRAHARNLLLVLISNEPLYHSLARVSYRIWADAGSGAFAYRPEDFGMGLEARELFAALGSLFTQLGSTPTVSEFEKILVDSLKHVRTEEHLRHCIFGWVEYVDRDRLFAAATVPALAGVVDALNSLVGVDEIVGE